MHMPLNKAAEALAVSIPFLRRKLSDKMFLKDGIEYCTFLEAADRVRCPMMVAEDVAAGKEWLMTSLDIRDVYGIDARHVKKVCGAAVFEGDLGSVYRISNLIKHYKAARAAAKSIRRAE